MEIKLLKKGIRIGSEYRSVWYSGASGNINGNATIYFKDYALPPGWYSALEEIGELVNETNSQTDYFEKPRIRIKPGTKFYKTILTLSGEN